MLLLLQGAAGHEVKALLPQPGQRRPIQLLHHWGHQASAADLPCGRRSSKDKSQLGKKLLSMLMAANANCEAASDVATE